MPQPKQDEVLIRVLACGLNNTDVNTRTAWYSKGVSQSTTGGALDDAEEDDATWGGAPITFPRIQGADVCGIVEQGPDEMLGKRVIVDPWLRDWTDPLNMDRAGYFGSECNGGFAQFVAIDARNAHVVDSDLSDAELATFPTA